MSSTESEIVTKIATIFSRVFRNVEFDVTRSMANTAEWSSLRHIQLLSGIEKQFGVEFEGSQATKLTSIEALVAFLAGKG